MASVLMSVARQGFAAPLRALDPMRHRGTPPAKRAAKKKSAHGMKLL
jgi:hypothetical protein